MKYVLKNKDETTNEVKPYILRANEELKPYFADCVEFDGKILEPILISNFQKDFLNSFGRTFWIVSYLPCSVIRSLLSNLDGLTHYAFCTHDRDFTQDDEVKKIHTHLLLYFDERVSSSYVAFWFHTLEIKIISRSNVSNEWNYLIHNSDNCRKQKKFLYPEKDRISDNVDYWLCRCTGINDNQLYVDLMVDFGKLKHGKLSKSEFIRRYGAFAIMQIKNIEHLFFLCGSVDARYKLEPMNDSDYFNEVF